MQVLLIRHDDDNTMHWHTYDDPADVRGHQGTPEHDGRSQDRADPEPPRDIRELKIRKIPLKD